MKEITKKKKLCFDFDERWIEVLLTKDVLLKEDVVKLIHEFNLNFTEKNWERRLPTKEMGIVLVLELKKDELIPILQKIIFEEYSHLLTYTEAKNILIFFNTLDENILRKLCINVCSNKKVAGFLTDEKNKQDFTKEDLLFNLIKEIYGVGDSI